MSFKRRNLRKIVLLLLGAALFAASTLAGELPYSDPRIGIAGGGGSTPSYGTFTFTSNEQGGGPVYPYDFYNATAETFFTLSVTTLDPGTAITCDGDGYFSSCYSIVNGSMVTIWFQNSSDEGDDGDPPGIPPGGDFIFTLNDDGNFNEPGGSGGWVRNALFSGAAYTSEGVAITPEPGTITLFVTFLGILAAKGKFRRRPSSSA